MRPRLLFVLLGGGALFSIALLHSAGLLRPLGDAARRPLLPLVRSASRIGASIGSWARTRARAAELETRVRELTERVRSHAVQQAALAACQEENASLRKLTKFVSESGYEYVPANVISRSLEGREATILLDRGSRDGLELGMAAVTNEGIYLGKLTTLRERVSLVTLLTDDRSRVAASRATAQGLIGLVRGEGNGIARLTLVPHAVPLRAQDIIITSGTEEKIPPHLVLGLVREIQGSSTDPFKNATLEPLVEVSRISLVAILRPSALRPRMP